MRICDVANDVPNKADTIFVDTNVWLFQTYPGATLGLSPARLSLIESYLRYFKRAKDAGATFVAFPTVALELTSVVEKEEYREICRIKKVQPFPDDPGSPDTLKACREDPGFRSTVASFAAQAWQETTSSAEVPEVLLTSAFCSQASELAASQGIDVMDALHLKLMEAQGITLVLTDDVDFSTLTSDVTVLTHNQKSLAYAAQHGTLKRR